MMRLWAFVFLLLLAGCQKGFQAEVAEGIAGAVNDNMNASNLLEWEKSQNHPHQFFQKALENDSPEVRKALCSHLLALPPEALQIFEEEFSHPPVQKMLAACVDQLETQMTDYWNQQKAQLRVNGLPTVEDVSESRPITQRREFKNSVQVRDVTNGYFAVTGDVQPKQIVLTFDDGPVAQLTPHVLAILKRFGARAMFFVSGVNVDAHPDILEQVAEQGHVIGNHSYYHWDLGRSGQCSAKGLALLEEWKKFPRGKPPCTTDAMVFENVKRGFDSIIRVLGSSEPFFRFPFGSQRSYGRQLLNSNGVAEFFWNVDTEDWKAAVKNPKTGLLTSDLEERVEVIVNQIDQKGRGIVLFHDIQRRTVEMLPAILDSLYERGYELVVFKSTRNNGEPSRS
ncbi:MAG: polysaccharide deacetylase family protein, partial [Proteobacteria bacterium]|nr:polysaccharide deacetylase family protein [Pseudomonadota bacterium]